MWFAHLLLVAILAVVSDGVRVSTDDTERPSSSVLERDLRKLPSSFFAKYNTSLSGRVNAEAAFRHFHRRALDAPLPEHFVPEENVQENAQEAFADEEATVREKLTPKELQRFEVRTVQELSAEAKHDQLRLISDPAQRDAVWSREVGRALQDQKPVATENMVEQINSAQLGWQADPQQAVQMSMLDAKLLAGFIKPPASTGSSSESALLQENASSEPLPLNFDARFKWPKCREVLSHVRNQGKCGSCWAQAATYVLESRLCIDSDGAFSGPSAWLSSMYTTACAAQKGDTPDFKFWEQGQGDGCDGGFAEWVFEQAKQVGIPTGSSEPGVGRTCAPYEAKGDSLEHFDLDKGSIKLQCPSSCSDAHHFRPLPNDMYKLQFQSWEMDSSLQAMGAILELGIVVFDFDVYRDFMTYKSGIYSPYSMDEGSKIGGHSTACFGFGFVAIQGRNVGFVKCQNSWGTDWGMNGEFHMFPAEVQIRFVAAGKIDLDGSVTPGIVIG